MRVRVLLACFFVSCSPAPQVDGGVPDSGSPVDAGAPDAGVPDAGAPDAGAADAGEPDAGRQDAGVDAGEPDAGEPDAGFDAGFDAGEPDAGEPIDAGPRLLDDAGCLFGSDVGVPFPLRLMAANLTSGNGQSYDPGHGIRIIQGLNPDVVMLQEMNYGDNTPAAMESFMRALDAGYYWSRGAGQIPNGVLSRHPIADAGEWPDPLTGTRGFAWALIDLPGPRDLFVVSVHLLTASPTSRNNEGLSVLARLNANVPSHDFVAVGGDFNTDTWDEPVFATLSARVVTDAGPPPPADQNGNENTNANRTKPYDQLLVSTCLLNVQLDAGIVFDSRVYTPLTDVPPILYGDSEAPNMQHMGVVKDFVVQP